MAPVTLLRKASWALCVLCGVTHPPARLPRWEAITPCFPFLSMLLFSNDEEVLVNVCEALALVLPGVPEPNLDKRLCELLALPSATIHRAAFQPLLNILRLDEPQSQLLVRAHLLYRPLSLTVRTDAMRVANGAGARAALQRRERAPAGLRGACSHHRPSRAGRDTIPHYLFDVLTRCCLHVRAWFT